MSDLLKQSSTAQPLMFFMADSTDHITGKAGLAPTVTLSKAGAAFGSPAGAVSEVANGWYKVAGNATDTNTLGPLILHATGTGADPADVRYGVVAFDPQIAFSGTATAGLSGGLLIAGSNAATTVNITGSLSGSVGSVTGAVGSVTGSVGSISGVTFPTNFNLISIDASGRVPIQSGTGTGQLLTLNGWLYAMPVAPPYQTLVNARTGTTYASSAVHTAINATSAGDQILAGPGDFTQTAQATPAAAVVLRGAGRDITRINTSAGTGGSSVSYRLASGDAMQDLTYIGTQTTVFQYLLGGTESDPAYTHASFRNVHFSGGTDVFWCDAGTPRHYLRDCRSVSQWDHTAGSTGSFVSVNTWWITTGGSTVTGNASHGPTFNLEMYGGCIDVRDGGAGGTVAYQPVGTSKLHGATIFSKNTLTGPAAIDVLAGDAQKAYLVGCSFDPSRISTTGTGTITWQGPVLPTIQNVAYVPQTGDSFARLGAPAGASVSADILTVSNQTADVQAKATTIITTTNAITAKTTNLPADPAGMSALAAAHGSGDWSATGSGGGTGTGNILVTHNYGGTDNYRVLRSSDNSPVDGAQILAFEAVAYTTGTNPTPDGQTFTGSDGRWTVGLMLDAGTYKLQISMPGEIQDKVVDLVVA